MKRAFLIFSIVAISVSCRNKDLCYLDHPHNGQIQDVLVVIHWPQQVYGPTTGMRTNLFQLDASSKSWINDLHCEGGSIKIPAETSYLALCYDYFGPMNINVRGENTYSGIEGYCGEMVRSTYSRAFPEENTVVEAEDLYVDKVNLFENPKNIVPNELHFYPENVTKTYTFEIRNVRGAKFITATRGALSGVSASYFISTGLLADTPSTVLFNAAPDPATDRIIGTIKTFGRVAVGGGLDNNFTIEILYPSAHNGIIQMSWDVTPQLDVSNHIIIDANIDIIPDANGGGSAFEVNVNDWEDIIVPIPI